MRQQSNSDIYFKDVSYDNVLSTWNIVRRTCKNKKAIFRYHINKNTISYNLYQILLNCAYKPYPFRLFLIFEPKPRLVMSQIVADKIVNHFVTKYYLFPYLEKKLLDCNVATRKGKGSKYAEKLLVDYINKIRIKNPKMEVYALKIDISKYFYTISHEILLQKLSRDIQDENVLNLLKVIIDETDKPYINEKLNKLNDRYGTNIPQYETGVGLSIGAMTSQFLAIYYLNDLDHFIKEKLGCKYYIRYMDDFVILDTDKENLKRIWKVIEEELKKLKLRINPKSCITSLNTGITFLGYKYKVENNKFKVLYRKKTINKINRKLKILKKYDVVKFYKSYGSYYGYLKKIKTWERKFTMKAVEKYEYFKKKHSKKVILVKEGSFYKTYMDDAKLLWHIFQYKWNNGAIAFGISNGSKVFDKLREQQIGYATVESDSDIIIVNGNDEVYDLYLKLSLINYDQQIKRNELRNSLDKLIEQDSGNYEKIKNYFDMLLKGDESNG